MSDLQQEIQQTIDKLVESGAERGLQVAVYKDGELVADAVSGVADPETGRPVTSDTLFYVTSTAKSMTSTVLHVLAEKGVVNYDTPIVDLWPEFGAHGKDKATIRHALSYMAGVPGVPADSTPETMADWDHTVAAIAATEPWWEPGTKAGYHPQTFGYIIGEIVRRATGKPISQVLREEVAEPLGVADELFIALPESELPRVARLEDGGPEIDPVMLEQMMPLFFKVAPLAVQPNAAWGNRTDILTSNGVGGSLSARAVARMYAALLGEVDGVRLVSPERLKELSSVAVDDVDQIFGQQVQYALGYSLGRPVADQPPNPLAIFGYPGAGGSYAEADTSTGTTFAVTKNKFTPGDFTTVGVVADVISKAG